MVDPQADLHSALSGKPGRSSLCGGGGECDSETLISMKQSLQDLVAMVAVYKYICEGGALAQR